MATMRFLQSSQSSEIFCRGSENFRGIPPIIILNTKISRASIKVYDKAKNLSLRRMNADQPSTPFTTPGRGRVARRTSCEVKFFNSVNIFTTSKNCNSSAEELGQLFPRSSYEMLLNTKIACVCKTSCKKHSRSACSEQNSASACSAVGQRHQQA